MIFRKHVDYKCSQHKYSEWILNVLQVFTEFHVYEEIGSVVSSKNHTGLEILRELHKAVKFLLVHISSLETSAASWFSDNFRWPTVQQQL